MPLCRCCLDTDCPGCNFTREPEAATVTPAVEVDSGCYWIETRESLAHTQLDYGDGPPPGVR